MFQENTKAEEATAELKGIVNHEYQEFVDRYDNRGVNYNAIHIESLPQEIRRGVEERQRIMSIMFGSHFDEHAQERVHARVQEMWEGRMTPKAAEMILPTLKGLHNKAKCEKCQDGHKLRIPTYETIEKAFKARNRGQL
jgi:hypothetical protein